MTTQDIARPVRLPHRSHQGIVMGMDGWQLTCVAIAAVVILISINRFGPPGLLYGVPVYLPIGAFAFVTVHGDSAPRQLGLWAMKQVRHAVGATTHTFRPERAPVAGTLNLPGLRASVQFWDVEGIACVYNPHDRSVSVTAEVGVEGFLMKDIPERFDLAQQWSPVLASFTQRPGIKRAVLQERTIPTTIRAARDHFDDISARRGMDASSPVARNYENVMDQSERFAVSHRNYLTFTLDLIALSPQLKSLGGGQEAIKALAALEAKNLDDALRAARISVRRWLSPRDVAALTRITFDPEFAANVQNRPDTEAGVDLAAIGPMYLEEPRGKNGIVYSDSGVHCTMWIHEWPRSAAAVGFVEPIVFARTPGTGQAITHILSIVPRFPRRGLTDVRAREGSRSASVRHGHPPYAAAQLTGRVVRFGGQALDESRPDVRTRDTARPPPHGRKPRDQRRRERQSCAAHARSRVRGDDVGHLRGPVRQRPRRGRVRPGQGSRRSDVHTPRRGLSRSPQVRTAARHGHTLRAFYPFFTHEPALRKSEAPRSQCFQGFAGLRRWR